MVSYAVPALVTSAPTAAFGTQDQGTISAATSVTLQNQGSAPLILTGLTFGGTDPQDYVVTFDGCLGPVAVGSSCPIGIGFAPQEQGASRAVLDIASNDPGSPATVSLSGTGGPLPTGPTGATGATGPVGAQGPAGATGAQGPTGKNGKVELITCRTIKRPHRKAIKKCVTRQITGTLEFTAAARAAGARARVEITRGRIVYAHGTVVDGRLVVSARRRLTRGRRYTLVLRPAGVTRGQTERMSVMIT
jgi:hypothetical protein